jgi:uncharacterized protein YecT (DUF1311 family)
MKTAYELAMERLEKDSGTTKKLSDAQRARIAEIDKKYDAKVAEARLKLDSSAASATTIEELNAVRASSADEMARFEELREKEKDGVWNEK